MIPHFRYATFRWLFALGNAVVWFWILYGLGNLVSEHFAQDQRLSREGALYFFALTPFVSCVLAGQGAILNLRAQYLIGRFSAPGISAAPPPPPGNVWLVSLRSALPLAAVALPLTLALGLFLPESISSTTTSRLMGAIGSVLTFVLAATIADREFRRFQYYLGDVRPRTASVAGYVFGHLAIPWSTVNGILNGIFAWILYHQGAGHDTALVTIDELRHDLAITTFMVCLFTAMEAIAEAETDFASGTTPLAPNLPAMPALWLRFVLAGGLASAVWLTISLAARLTASEGITLFSTILIKALGGGLLAAAVAVVSGRWALARCHTRAQFRAAGGHRSAGRVVEAGEANR
ncbi:MAG TPA: hypothetical protein VL403_20960 [Candidatus Kryptonia bacterium]|nr:hypothetical protein [Candidatus Kryptonia bacterium]